jgi:hypothetical protein
MSLLQNLKDLATKGPKGLVDERMKEHLASADEMMKLDRSDPEAMRRYTAEQNAHIEKTLSGASGKNMISDENRAGIERIQNEAIDNQAVMWKMMQEYKAKQPATSEAPIAPKDPETGK